MAILIISSLISHLIFLYPTINLVACSTLTSDTFFQSVNLNQPRDDIYQTCTRRFIKCLSSNKGCISNKNCSNLASLENTHDLFKLTINVFDNFEGQIKANFLSANGQQFEFVCDSENKSFAIKPSDSILNWSFNEVNERVVCLAWFKVNQDGFAFTVATNEMESNYSKMTQLHSPSVLEFLQMESFITNPLLFNVSQENIGEENVTEIDVNTNDPIDSTWNEQEEKNLDYILLLSYALPFVVFILIILLFTIKKISRQEDDTEEGETNAANSEAAKTENQTSPSNETENHEF